MSAYLKKQVLAAVRHEKTDCLPFDIFEGWMWPQIQKKLMNRMGATDQEQLRRILGVSCRWISPRYNGPELPLGAKDRVASPHTTHSLNASIWGMRPGLKEHGLGAGGHPLAGAESVDTVARYTWPSCDWFDYSGLLREAELHRDYFVIVGGFTPLFYLIGDLCGMEKTLLDMTLNPKLIHALCERISDFYRGYISNIASACGSAIDAIAFGDDFSSQLGMLMNPEQWRQFFLPAWSMLFGLAKSHGYKVMFHSCGSMYEVIPDLMRVGLDILYPVQPMARSMAIELLHQKFGADLSFYGGFDVQHVLPFGTAAEIDEEVRRIAKVFAGKGGYIFSTSHTIMEDVPAENVVRMYEQVRKINS